MYTRYQKWKTDYFEIRYEDPTENKRYFYKLDGEGIRYELVAFLRAIKTNQLPNNIPMQISANISKVINIWETDSKVVHLSPS